MVDLTVKKNKIKKRSITLWIMVPSIDSPVHQSHCGRKIAPNIQLPPLLICGVDVLWVILSISLPPEAAGRVDATEIQFYFPSDNSAPLPRIK